MPSQKIPHNTSTTTPSPPSPTILATSLFFAVTTCSSAGVAFSALSTSYGVPAALAASWRLWCCEIIQLIPFLVSLRNSQRRDESKAFLEEWKMTTHLVLNSSPSFHSNNSLFDLGNQNHDHHHHNDDEAALYQQTQSNDSKNKTTTTSLLPSSLNSNTVGSSSTPSSSLNRPTGIKLKDPNPPSLFLPKYKSALPLMALSGVFLGIHFSAWVYSIEKTSLFHSLLFVSMGPIILNGGQWILVFLRPLLVLLCVSFPTIPRPSKMETIGVLVGMCGTLFILYDIQSTSTSNSSTTSTSASTSIIQPTFEGDIMALIGAFAVSMYLLIGQNLRTWIPLWLYTFPVIFFAMLTSICLAYLDPNSPPLTIWFDGSNSSWSDESKSYGDGDSESVVVVNDARFSVFGFLNPKFLWLSLYLGAGPGVCGHTLLNALLKYLSPLTISTALLAEPVIGSILGYFFGMQDLPHLGTCIGAMILLVGLLLVIAGEGGCQSMGDIWNGMGFLLSGGTNTAAVTATERDEVQQGGRGGACRKKGEESYGIEQDSKGSYGTISFKRERCESGDPIL